jgi:glycosyltransferase involved in cell wall biosynthesis
MTDPTPGRPLRVLYVNHSAIPAGSVRSLRFLIESFPPGSVQAFVVSPPGLADQELQKAGATVLPIPAVSLYQNIRGLPVRGFRWGTVLRATLQRRHGHVIRDAVRSVDPDLVHLNDHGMFQAGKIARSMGKPVVMHVRAVADTDSWWQNRVTRRFVRKVVSRVITIDESVLRSMGPIENACVVYNPIGGLGTGPGPSPERPPGPVTFSFLAGLADFKGVDDLLDCAALLKDRKDIRFRIYGQNRWPPAYYRSLRGRIGTLLGMTRDVEGDLRRRIERDGLQETVGLMGHVPAEAGVFQETDVVVFPSRLNGVGRSVFEGGGHGIPSIVTLKDKVEDIVVDGVTGILVPEQDPRAMADAVRRLADDPALRRSLGAKAREKYREQFDPPRIGRQMLEIYRSVLAR